MIHTWRTMHSYVWHELVGFMTWRIRACVMMYVCVPWLIHVRDVWDMQDRGGESDTSAGLCVCVCVCARERERESVCFGCLCVGVCVWQCLCLCVCLRHGRQGNLIHLLVCVFVCVCLCARERGRECFFLCASVLVFVSMWQCLCVFVFVFAFVCVCVFVFVFVCLCVCVCVTLSQYVCVSLGLSGKWDCVLCTNAWCVRTVRRLHRNGWLKLHMCGPICIGTWQLHMCVAIHFYA